MKKLTIGILIIGVCFGFIISDFGFNKSQAQPLYTGIYWILGNVSGGPDNVNPDNRKVVLFKDTPANGFAFDISGPTGQAGATAKYRINADEDERMNIVPGKYQIAIVKKDNYGMNPATVEVTGKGFDIFDVTLRYGEGIEDPGTHVSSKAPHWESIYFNQRLWQPLVYTGLTEADKFIISPQPKIVATVVSEYGIDKNMIKMLMNEGSATQTMYTISPITNIIKAEGPSESPTRVTFIYDFVQAQAAAVPLGDQKFTFRASNAYGTGIEVVTATVLGGERAFGIITYPSPVRLNVDNQVVFQYTLSSDMNIDIYVFDISGRVAKKMSFAKYSEGGSAGINKPAWDLITDQGQKLAAQIALFNLVNRDTGKLLGKGKLTAVPQ